MHEAQGRTHAEFCHLLRMSMAFDHLLIHTGLISYNRPQATDILVGVDREPITAKWLSAVLRREVAEFRAEESDAVRYLMSDACRIKLRYVQHDQFPPAPSSLFLKRVLMEDLPHAKLKQHTVPHKITRDVASYQVESAFLSSKACKSFSANGTRIVAPFYIDLRPAPPGEPPIHSRFLLLLEDFSPEDGWFQADLFNKTEAVSSLEALASYHAFFWNFSCDNSYPELCEGVWKQATFWLPSRQSQDCFEKLASYWEMHRCSFGDVFDESVFGIDGGVNAKRFGYTLARFAPACAERVHAVGLDVSHPHRTLLHGDAKSANIFLKRHATDSTCKSQCEGDLFVGLIDFQWCGWGHPAVDVAYLIAGSTSSDVLFSDENNEDFLLERYYEHFLNCLINMGKVNTWAEAQQCMTSEELKSYYSDAIVDIARMVISNLWVRIKASPEVLKSRSKIRGSNSYNKDVCCAKWLIKRTTAILSSKLEQRRIP